MRIASLLACSLSVICLVSSGCSDESQSRSRPNANVGSDAARPEFAESGSSSTLHNPAEPVTYDESYADAPDGSSEGGGYHASPSVATDDAVMSMGGAGDALDHEAPSSDVAEFGMEGDDDSASPAPGSAGRSERMRKERILRPERQSQNRRGDGYRPGTLTAGSINDHAKIREFYQFLSLAGQSRIGPCIDIRHRVIVRVQTEDGKAVADARITIQPAAHNSQNRPESSQEQTWFTGTDGETVFLPGFDRMGSESDFVVTVEMPGIQDVVTQQFSLQQPLWDVVVAQAANPKPAGLDLALVIDTTGSMSDELEYLKAEIDDIAASVHEQFPNVNQRFSLILYRDQGDEYVTRTFDFTESLGDFREKLSVQSAAGGGDYPEAMHVALKQAENLSWRGDGTARVLFLVGDAPPHSQFAQQAIESIRALRDQRVTMFPVAASGVKEQAELIMRSAAFITGGQYLFLTDHSGVGNAHAKPHTSSYAVEPLNQLMVRMIASELSGESVQPQDIIAIEDSLMTGIDIPADRQTQQRRRPVHAAVPYSPPPRPVPEQASVIPQSVTLIAVVAGLLLLAAIDHRSAC